MFSTVDTCSANTCFCEPEAIISDNATPICSTAFDPKIVHARTSVPIIKNDVEVGQGYVPYATLAYQIEGITSAGLHVSYAAAYCHPNDNYVKKVGRAKALGRLRSLTYKTETTVPFSKDPEKFDGQDWRKLETYLLHVGIEPAYDADSEE